MGRVCRAPWWAAMWTSHRGRFAAEYSRPRALSKSRPPDHTAIGLDPSHTTPACHDHAHPSPGPAPGIATPTRHQSGPARYCARPPAVLATCSRAGARLHYFPRELWVVPSAEAPLGRAAAEPGGTREPLNPGQQPRQRARGGRGARTRERRARPSAGSRPDVSNRRPSGGGGAFSALSADAPGRLWRCASPRSGAEQC